MKFSELNINSSILDGIDKMEYSEMTKVQESVIPLALDGLDIICQAPTGTGKTLAFAIPILQKIKPLNKVQAIILSPTRELAVQIATEINEVAKSMLNVKAMAIYGGEAIDKQIYNLKKTPQVIVATPGRLIDHLERRTIKLSEVSTIILDEADEMLDMGFIEDIKTILNVSPSVRQTMLFSATISKEIEEIGKEFLNNPKTIRINAKRLTIDLVKQFYIDVKENDKIEAITRILDINDFKLVMVFCNTKKTVDLVTSGLLLKGFLAEALHGDMRQMQRDRVMERFRSGQIDILIASDVAARGLDISDVDLVMNYDVPTEIEYYVHRIGRTGRAKKSGISITLVTRSEKTKLKEIIKYTHSDIEQMMIPSLEKVTKYRVKKQMYLALNTENDELIKSYVLKEIKDINEVDKDRLILGLINLNLKDKKAVEEINTLEGINERETTRKIKQKMVRVFCSAGKKDKIKVYTLTDLLTKKTDLTNDLIDNVELHDNFSFFDIPEKFANDLVKKTINYKGIDIKFEIAKLPKNKKSGNKAKKK